MNKRFAFDGRDQWECDIQIIPVALSDAMFSVGGGDHIKNDIQSFVVTPLTDPLLKFAFDARDHFARDIHLRIVALSNAISSVGGGDHKCSGIQVPIPLTDPFAFDGCDPGFLDTQQPAVALSNAILSVSGGDQTRYDIHSRCVTPLTDLYTQFAFDSCDQCLRDTHHINVALSNAIPSVSGGDQREPAILPEGVTPLTDPFMFDGCNQTCVDTHPAGIALSNSVSGGDQVHSDTHHQVVTPLTDPLTSDMCDHTVVGTHARSVALSDVSSSVGGGDQGSIDTHWLYVIPLTDPLIQFAFDGRDHAKRDTHQMCVALSNAISSVSGGDQYRPDTQVLGVTPLTDPLRLMITTS